MNKNLAQLLEKLTAEEETELETFAAFLLARRSKKLQLISDEISTEELTQLVTDSGSFDWLDSPEEDVYSLEDGQPVRWPNNQ